MHFYDWLGLVVYFVVLIYIGFRSAKRVKSSADFAVAGNKIIWPVLFATLSASFLGGGASLGRAGEAFTRGYSFMFAASAFPIATVLVGIFIAPKLKRYLGAQTVGDVMQHHFGSTARFITGSFSLIYCTGILGAQALAIGTVFHSIVGIDLSTGIILGMAVVLVYSTAGGMWAVIQTDVIQFVMLAIFMPLTMIIALNQLGGADGFISQLPEKHFSVMGNYSVATFVSVFIAFLLGETLVPPYTQRALAAPDARNAKIGYTISGLFGFLFYFVTSTIGLLALVMYPDLGTDQALPTLIRSALPIGIVGLVLASLLAVVMSTADSFLNSASVIFVKDIYLPFLNPAASEKKRLRVERILNLAIGAGAVAFALYASSIIDALLMTYTLWAPVILIPFVAGVMFDIKNPKAGLSAMICGALITVFWKWSPFDLSASTGISALIAGVATNLSVFILVHKMTGNIDPLATSAIVESGE
jgi:solute:Na+ symporter, SSS family